MKKVWQKNLLYLVFFCIGGILLYLTFREVDLESMKKYFSEVKVYPLILSFIMGALAYLFRGLRWNHMFESMGYKISNKAVGTHAVSFGYFMNIIMPRAGEFARAMAFYKVERVPLNKVMGTILAERVIDFIFLFFFVGLSLWVNQKEFDKLIDEYISFDLNSLYAIAAIVLILIFTALIAKKMIKGRVLQNRLLESLARFLSGIKKGLFSVGKIKDKFSFWAYTFLIWAMYYFMVAIVFYAFPELDDFGFSEGLFLFMIGAIGMVMPTPGGVGSYHFAIMTGFYLLGQGKDLGLAFATILHALHSILAIIFGGGASFVLLYYRKKRKAKEQFSS